MMDPLATFSAERALTSLHAFQRDAVAYAFHRLFIAPDSTRRFLLADEVGLGKTLIAKGILARALELLRDRVERIDVIYICSNLGIANQNIQRLNPIPGLEFSNAERITLLPLTLKDMKYNRVNFIAFTPGTSLDLKGSMGTRMERLLLYAMLREHWGFKGVGPLNVLQGTVRDAEGFRADARRFRDEYDISPELQRAFLTKLDKDDLAIAAGGAAGLQEQFFDLVDVFRSARSEISKSDRSKRAGVISALRTQLARTCIAALEPDLIILDEFQRFKDLLSGGSEAAELASQLFEWSSEHTAARVLLLSATPYKAYTIYQELADENHYEDFLRTVAFLDNDAAMTGGLEKSLGDYRRALFALGDSDSGTIHLAKQAIETHLRRVMSRTERLAVVGVKNGMLRSVEHVHADVHPEDLQNYITVRKLANHLKVDDVVEYWKSAAYPLNFMEGYKLKEALRSQLDTGNIDEELRGLLAAVERQGLPFDKLSSYAFLDVPNARLRAFAKDLGDAGAFDILWMPPSLPYYQMGEALTKAHAVGLTKQLVFSAWHVAPRSISALLSYEAERRAFSADEAKPLNTADARKARRGLLRFSRSDGRLTGMPLMTMLYPSRALAELCDPRAFPHSTNGCEISMAAVIEWAKSRIRAALPSEVSFADPGQVSDERWYWAAPIVLDRDRFPNEVEEWWSIDDLSSTWSYGDQGDMEDESTDQSWSDHVDEASALAHGKNSPLGRAPHDLLTVLAFAGLGGAANCALRSLLSHFPANVDSPALDQRVAAAVIAWGFRSLFNRPEAMAIVRHGDRREPYWKHVLRFAAEGCLAAVLDEYIAILKDDRGVSDANVETGCVSIALGACYALTLRSATLDVEQVVGTAKTSTTTLQRHSMRTLFAVRFGSDRTEDTEQAAREMVVRSAFNSPFWPFVLASTSVGQEGLDFHRYCHAVVHWNLPSNPVDFEQREGRVHRYKGHAVRKNVASRHGQAGLKASPQTEIWGYLFDLAQETASPTDRGLVPFWVYPMTDGAWIERHVPLFPFSQDAIRYQDLRRSLAAYRMVFGQPRQDELLAYLLDRIDPKKIDAMSESLRIDLAPPTTIS